MTGSPGKAFLIAALFAWHPVKVESVAWIAERKDVLSTFFVLLSLLAYTGPRTTSNEPRLGAYVARGPWSVALPLVFFVLSLLCKPMYVTLPIVLFLIDFWPLNRNEGWAKRLLEKVPFIILSAISSFVTFHAQAAGGAINHFSDYPVLVRFANISQAYWDYILLFLWPAKLSIFYPYVPNAHVGQSLFIGFIFALITGAFYFRRKQSPAIWTGWCLFGIMLIPVIGVITIGAHWIACRYLYGPAIGLSIMLIWGGEALLSKLHFPKKIIYIFSTALLGGYVSVTSVHLGVWQNSYKLFKHAEQTVPNNWIAHVSLRAAYGRDGDNLKAAEHLIEAIRIFPDITNRISLHWLDFYYMGQVKLQSGQMMQSESYLRESARRLSEIKPDDLFSDSLPQRKNLSACLAAFDAKQPEICKL